MILITAKYSLDKDNNKVANQKPIFVISEHSKPAHGNIQPLFILWILSYWKTESLKIAASKDQMNEHHDDSTNTKRPSHE